MGQHDNKLKTRAKKNPLAEGQGARKRGRQEAAHTRAGTKRHKRAFRIPGRRLS